MSLFLLDLHYCYAAAAAVEVAVAAFGLGWCVLVMPFGGGLPWFDTQVVVKLLIDLCFLRVESNRYLGSNRLSLDQREV